MAEAYNLRRGGGLPPHDGSVCKNGIISLPSELDSQIFSLYDWPTGSQSLTRGTYGSYNGYIYSCGVTYNSQLSLNTGNFDFYIKGTIGVALIQTQAYNRVINEIYSQAIIDGQGVTDRGNGEYFPPNYATNINYTKTYNKFTLLSSVYANLMESSSWAYVYLPRNHYIYFLPDCTLLYKRK